VTKLIVFFFFAIFRTCLKSSSFYHRAHLRVSYGS